VPIPLAPIIAGAAALGGVGLVIKARSNAAKAQLAAECEDLRTQLELASVAGHSSADIQQLTIRLAACARRAGSAGVAIDPVITGLLPCTQQREYIDRVWTDYKATSYSDPVARDNKRNNILAAGAEMVRCLRAQLELATTPAQIRAVMAEMEKARSQSFDRAQCMFAGTSGCGRFGLNEEHGNDRGWYELQAIAVPLGEPWAPGYAALQRLGEFKSAAGLPDNFPVVTGTYGGLKKTAEAKLATAEGRAPLLRAGVGTLVTFNPAQFNIGRTLRG